MSREVNSLEEALDILKSLGIAWTTTNKIQNSMWETGVAFFGRNHHRVAYFDEVQNELSF